MAKKNLGTLVKDNLQKVTIGILSILFITQGVFEFSKKDTTISEILGGIFFSLLIGMIVTANFITMGLKAGRKDDVFVNSQLMYGETKEKATPFFDKLSIWCNYKNKKDLELKKKDIINSAGLNWKGYVFGYYDEHKEKLTKEQLEALEQAKKAKIPKISSSELLSDLPTKKDAKTKFGLDEKEYKVKTSANDVFTKIFTAIISGLFTLSPLINGNNYQEVLSNVLWNASQVLMWLCFGALKYENAKAFMIDEYRQTHIIQKTELLNEFIITMENNPQVVDEFEENIEINNFIEDYLKEVNKDNGQKEVLDKNDSV